MKRVFAMVMILAMMLTLGTAALAEGQEAGEWNREGYYEDENGNMLSVTWMDLDYEAGWYVGFMNGEDMIEDSYGGMTQQEGNTLHGSLLSGGEKGELTVTISEEGEDGLLLVAEGGESFHFTPMFMQDATIFVTINVDGWGNIDYTEGDAAPEIDTEYPYQSAQINLAEPTVHTFVAWANEGWHFVKWTRDGEDFSTENTITIELAESADYVAVFGTGIDYLALVNKNFALPDGWEQELETVTVTNSVGDEVEVESRAYDAYLQLKNDLEENDGIWLELDSARRSVAEQQDIMDRFIEKYGEDYAVDMVAQPGFSEHHTGLALDLYFRLKDENGEFTDVYYNEDLVQYPEIWDKIHAKLADYGFILRYPEGREHITGYGYEPWHIRYLDDVDTAKEIMSEGITLEEYLGAATASEVTVDYGSSEIFTQEDLEEAVLQIKCRFAEFAGCELHSIRYAGDESCSEENLRWMNELNPDGNYTQVAEFLMDLHSPEEDGLYAWEPDTEYTDYQWWLARSEGGAWDILTFGY